MGKPHPKVSSVSSVFKVSKYPAKMTDAGVKLTDPLASYRSNSNFNVKFYSRL